jgi:penicillin-binding protein 1A
MRDRSVSRRGFAVITAVIVLLVLVLIAAAVAGWFYWQEVVVDPGEHISRDNIQAIIAEESPVYYRDGVTPIGVFFAKEHRIYVPYADIPEAWVWSITAAEDQRFFSHSGLDLQGFARAMKQNLSAGKLVSGGSTLTMQTAENLFYDGAGDPWSAKLVEVVNTLRLERHYSKEDILEFYANQFHVSGNGRGIGVAARYFFDKDVTELTLQECAFIAGLVKAPAYYNPFVGSEERREQAREKARKRTNYVLDRLLEEGRISAAEHAELFNQPVPFKRGNFRYDSSVLLDEVQRRMELAPFPQLFKEAGIDNPSTAGIQVITTLDEGAQRSATYGLWHHLTDAGTLLEGQGVDAFFHPEVTVAHLTDPPQPMGFYYGRITGGDKAGVRLDLGGYEGIIDRPALERAYAVLAHARAGNAWTQPTEADKEALRGSLEAGAVVWVSARREQPDGADGKAAPLVCDLEIRPELQGGLIALESGQIRAMVGGNDNRNFNRAVTAKRQLGSTWKSLVYFAALQLGWTPLDELDNRRGVFPFEGTWYYPRPDHEPADFVSLAWAGVNSENLATIWLLYHLTDRLNDEQVRRLAELTDLAPREGEGRVAYIERIRDTHGIVATEGRLEAGLLNAVREQVIADLAFSGNEADAVEVRSLHYGLGFDQERARVRGQPEKLAALDHSLVHYEALMDECRPQAKALSEQLKALEKRRRNRKEDDEGGGGLLDKLKRRAPERKPAAAPVEALDPGDVDRLTWRRDGRRVELACGRSPEGFEPMDREFLAGLGDEKRLKVDLDVLLDGRLHATTVSKLREAIDARVEKLGPDPDYYDPELLYLHPDFRVMLGLKYMSGLAGALGVDQELPPVVSMPLGAVDISLEQAATIYQGFLHGERWRFPGAWYEESGLPGLDLSNALPGPDSPTLLIAEIRDRAGNVIYKAEPTPEVVADPVAGELVNHILRNVVRHGTGQRARGMLGGWPVGGKTGTTNEFKNAAFVGYVPVKGAGRSPWVLASYVGYDDNRPMLRSGSVLAGANGALPAWIGAIEGFAAEELLGERPEEVEPEQGFALAAVAEGVGLKLGRGEDTAAAREADREVLVYGTPSRPLRRYAPFTERAEETEAEEPPVAPTSEEEPAGASEDDEEELIDDIDDPSIEGASIWDAIEEKEGR